TAPEVDTNAPMAEAGAQPIENADSKSVDAPKASQSVSTPTTTEASPTDVSIESDAIVSRSLEKDDEPNNTAPSLASDTTTEGLTSEQISNGALTARTPPPQSASGAAQPSLNATIPSDFAETQAAQQRSETALADSQTPAPEGSSKPCETYRDYIARVNKEEASAADLNAGMLAELNSGGVTCQ
ncbi:MAG: hypothetical protein AAF850_03735, partial [Pseudomonadota bacterium]